MKKILLLVALILVLPIVYGKALPNCCPADVDAGEIRAYVESTWGEYDPDRPSIGRLWESTEGGGLTRRTPAANTRIRPIGQRRFKRTYKKRYW